MANGEIDAEAHYESSLRRVLGDDFNARYTEGLALAAVDMIPSRSPNLNEITKT